MHQVCEAIPLSLWLAQMSDSSDDEDGLMEELSCWLSLSVPRARNAFAAATAFCAGSRRLAVRTVADLRSAAIGNLSREQTCQND
jgi:hypothetical protein